MGFWAEQHGETQFLPSTAMKESNVPKLKNSPNHLGKRYENSL